jgi:hypothetical protein
MRGSRGKNGRDCATKASDGEEILGIYSYIIDKALIFNADISIEI